MHKVLVIPTKILQVNSETEIKLIDLIISEVKTSETPLIFQSSSMTTKESNENESLLSNSNKRPHVDDNSESIYTSEIDEQLSPSKRARRSVSSQESFETFR